MTKLLSSLPFRYHSGSFHLFAATSQGVGEKQKQCKCLKGLFVPFFFFSLMATKEKKENWNIFKVKNIIIWNFKTKALLSS